VNWKLYVDSPEKRALDLCRGSMDEGDGRGSPYSWGPSDDGWGNGDAGYSYGTGCGNGYGYGLGNGNGYGWGAGFVNGDGYSSTEWK